MNSTAPSSSRCQHPMKKHAYVRNDGPLIFELKKKKIPSPPAHPNPSKRKDRADILPSYSGFLFCLPKKHSRVRAQHFLHLSHQNDYSWLLDYFSTAIRTVGMCASRTNAPMRISVLIYHHWNFFLLIFEHSFRCCLYMYRLIDLYCTIAYIDRILKKNSAMKARERGGLRIVGLFTTKTLLGVFPLSVGLSSKRKLEAFMHYAFNPVCLSTLVSPYVSPSVSPSVIDYQPQLGNWHHTSSSRQKINSPTPTTGPQNAARHTITVPCFAVSLAPNTQ